MEKRTLSVEQLKKMIRFMEKVNLMVGLFLNKSDLTAEEQTIAKEVKQATESYIRILGNLPESDAEFWAPVLKAVITEIIRQVFGELPEPLMKWLLENLDKFDDLDFWTKTIGISWKDYLYHAEPSHSLILQARTDKCIIFRFRFRKTFFNTMAMTNLGSTLLALRHERGLKLKNLSEVTKLSVPYLSAIENDKRTPDLNVIGVICFALGIEPYELLFKAAIEEKIAPERRRLVRELLPVLVQMQQLAKQIYDNDDEDDKPNGNEGPIKPNGIARKPAISKKEKIPFIQEDNVPQEELEELELA